MPSLDKSADLITEKLAKLCQQIEDEVKKSIEEPPPEQRFISVKLKRDQAVAETREALYAMQVLMAKGIKAIYTSLVDMGKQQEVDQIADWFTNNSENITAYLDSKNESMGDKTMEEILHFPRQYLIHMHEAATYLLGKNRFEESLMALSFCLQINPLLPTLWTTYGITLQHYDQQQAINAFTIASDLDEENPYIHCHKARSLIALGKRAKAIESIKQAKEICEKKPEYTEIKTYCNELEEWMKKNP